MILESAMILQLAATCAASVAPQTAAAIVHVESGGDPLAIHDNTTRQSQHPNTIDEFMQIAGAGLAAGHSLDLGLMQINDRNLRWLGLTLADTADPCKSLRAGAEVLTSMSRYNSGSPTRSIAYAVRVNAVEHGLPSGAAAPAAKPPETMPAVSWNVFPDPGEQPDFLTKGDR